MRTFTRPALAFLLALMPAATALAQQEPPRRLDLADPATRAADTTGRRYETSQELRARFVRDQTVLGLGVYAPAFAVMVGNDGVTGVAGYLVMAGGSFFAAAEVTRRVRITEARHVLSTGMAGRFAANALLIAGQSDMDARPAAALTLLGGLGGTATGLAVGGGLTGGEAAATVFGHDLAWLTAFALTVAGDEDPFDSTGVDRTTSAVGWAASGIGGYFAGRWYAGRAPHNVTVGDVQTMWLGATVGMLGGWATIASTDPGNESAAPILLGGAWLGTVLAERTLVRRADHSRAEANMLALGAGAGSLMGMGVGILVAGEGQRDGSTTLGFATLGAVGGIAMAERYLQPTRDAGRLAWLDRVQVAPTALAAAAAGAPGRHTLLRFSF